MRRLMLAVALVALPLTAQAADAPADAEKPDPEIEGAKAVLKGYLDGLVKAAEGKKPKPADVAKKLAATAKKSIHPKTLELIAAQEKKNLVTNALAVWVHAKEDYWLMEYTMEEARQAALGAIVIEAKEKNWRVAEGGEDGDPEPTSYLLGKTGAKWLVIDKRRNEAFTNDGIKAGYREYFEAAKKEPAPTEAKPADAKEAPKKP
jgi:hypothetical protein